ncbi:MAG: hypothetical protein U1E76_15060 [Planctomycetota bacterium]
MASYGGNDGSGGSVISWHRGRPPDPASTVVSIERTHAQLGVEAIEEHCAADEGVALDKQSAACGRASSG